MGQGLDKIERQYDSIAREYAEAFIGDCLTDIGFEKIEVIEREPYPGWSTKAEEPMCSP